MTGRVTGVGGIFFRAKDPDALGEWYKTHLGITPNGEWPQDPGYAVLGLFRKDTDYWPEDRQFMFNIRVDDMDTVTARLKAAGIEIITDPEWDMPEYGRFARIHDPEGNPIELWEPAGGDA